MAVQVYEPELNLEREVELELGINTETRAGPERHRELGAYEALFLEKQMSYASIASKFGNSGKFAPSSLCDDEIIDTKLEELESQFSVDDVKSIQFVLRGEADYPDKLLDAKPAIQLLYYKGDASLFKTKSIAIVGSRKASDYGKKLGAKISKELVKKGFTIVSGLADGIDVAAHRAAIDNGGKTIGVLGTPINYPTTRAKRDLVDEIQKNHLLVSQIPVLYYGQSGFQRHKSFFLERNATVSALSVGTVVVEAGDISGSLSTARHAIKQNKKLFIPSSCFKNDRIKWPEKFRELGAIRVNDINDIIENCE